jgi:hydroxypyruvate reductase
MTPRLICAAPLPAAVAERAAEQFAALLSPERELTLPELLQKLDEFPSVQAILTSGRIRFDRAAIAALPERVKILATCSVGIDHIDLAAAAEHGLLVSNTPDVLTDATADLAFLLLLGAARRAREYLQIMDRGWRERYGLGEMLGIDVAGGMLGIVGMGRIGQAMARRARGFGMTVLYHNRSRLPEHLEEGARYYPELMDMLPHCRFLSLHAPGGDDTDGIIGRAAFERLPAGAVLVNTSRGPLVDDEACLEALTSGRLAAAGLDVFRKEPEYDLRYRDLPNVFLTPHMGSATVGTRNAMGFKCLDNIAAVLDGDGAPPDRVA